MRDVLDSLSDSEKGNDEKFRELASVLENEVYIEDFRHSYAEFFPIVSQMMKKEKDNEEYSLQINLRDFIDYLYKTNKCDLVRHVHKILDHINLEVARFSYLLNGPEAQIEAFGNKLMVEQDKFEIKIKEFDTQMEKVAGEAREVQTQFVSILGVFAAIIVSFSGGMAFMGSILSGLKDVSTLKAVTLALVCGLILFNLIFMMMYFVGKLTGRNIYAKDPQKVVYVNCCGLTLIRKKLPYVFWMNFFLLLALFFCLCYAKFSYVCYLTSSIKKYLTYLLDYIINFIKAVVKLQN